MEGMTEPPGITLVCCGLIGTLVADEGLIERAFAEAIATQGVVVGTGAYARRMAQVHHARGQVPADLLAGLFPENQARAQAAHIAFERAIADAIGRSVVRPIPGAKEILADIAAAGARTCVLTSLPRRALRIIVDALGSAGWRDVIDVALSAEEIERGFPAPDPVLTAMLRVGVGDVAEAAVVHATAAGVEGARHAGAGIAVGVLTGAHPAPRLRAAGATHVIASIADLPAALKASGLDLTVAPATVVRTGQRRTRPGSSGATSTDPASINVPPQVPLARRTSGL
jgi:phosphoglycolate phosphatase